MFFRDKISKAGIVSLEHAITQPDVKLEGLEVVQTKFSYIWHCCLLGVTFQYLTRLNFLLILVPARWTRAWIDWNELQQRTMAANIQITFWNLRWYCKRAVSTKHMICFSPYTWMSFVAILTRKPCQIIFPKHFFIPKYSSCGSSSITGG